MITDAQVDAAARAIAEIYGDADATIGALERECPLWVTYRDQARHALEAAEAAAWSSDMEAAPHGEAVLVYAPESEDGPALIEVDAPGGYIFAFSATHWRPLPALPESLDKETGNG